MPEHDARSGNTEGAGGAHVFEITAFQEFGAHVIRQADPAEHRQQDQQQTDRGFEDRGENNQQIQFGQRTPHFDESLKEQVDLAAEIALHRARQHPDHHADGRERKTEQYRQAETVNQPGGHVAAPIIGTEPVPCIGRRGIRGGVVVIDGVVGERDRCAQQPAVFADFGDDVGVGVIGIGREIAPERGFRVIVNQRQIELMLIKHQQGSVVRQQFRPEAQHKQDGKYPQAEITAAMAPETLPNASPRALRWCL